MELRVGVKILLKNKDSKYPILQRSKIKYLEPMDKYFKEALKVIES